GLERQRLAADLDGVEDRFVHGGWVEGGAAASARPRARLPRIRRIDPRGGSGGTGPGISFRRADGRAALKPVGPRRTDCRTVRGRARTERRGGVAAAGGPAAGKRGGGPPQRGTAATEGLLADAELPDDGAVPLDVGPRQVVEEAAALADHLEQAEPGRVVLRVALEVLGELVDARGEQGDLDLGLAGVLGAGAVLLDELLLLLGADHGGVSASDERECCFNPLPPQEATRKGTRGGYPGKLSRYHAEHPLRLCSVFTELRHERLDAVEPPLVA